MKNIWIYTIILIAMSSCSGKIDKGKIWSEKIDVGNGAHIYLYHDAKCSRDKTYSCVTEDKISFMKKKYDVFDYCFSSEDLEMLNFISKHNIKDYNENAIHYCEDNEDFEYYKRYSNLLDTLDCGHSTDFAMDDKKLVKLKKTWYAMDKQ